MKVLLTGGTGFVGGHAADALLEAGHAVRVFSRRSEMPGRFRGRNAEIFLGDLEDFSSLQEALEGVEIFFHIGEIRNINRRASEKNVRLMEHIAGILKKSSVRRLVFVSSITVAGIPSEIPADENTKPATVLKDHYTSYKRKCERIITEKLVEAEYAIIRPAPVYGPGSRYFGRFLSVMEKAASLGIPFPGSARNLAPLVYVEDLAKAICLAGTEPGATGEVFNITDGFRHSWFDFLEAVANRLGKKLRVIPVPPSFLKFPAVFLNLFSGLLNMELDLGSYVEFFSKDIFFANTKAGKLLGWKPAYTLKAGIRKTVKAYRGAHFPELPGN